MLLVTENVRPRSLMMAAALINAAQQIGLTDDMVIRYGSDGQHMAGSRHYTGDAIDFRTRHLLPTRKHALIEAMRARLGKDFQVILEDEGSENEHGHCEWDPRH